MSLVSHILEGLCELSPRQRHFFAHLLCLWPCLNGRFTLLNLSRYRPFCERTFRRHLARPFPGSAFNAALIHSTQVQGSELMLALDASFVPKGCTTTKETGTKEIQCKDLALVRATQTHWPQGVRHFALDRAYARRSFVEDACTLGLQVVSRLRADANVRYLYTDPQSGRGHPKLCAGKRGAKRKRACASTAPLSTTSQSSGPLSLKSLFCSPPRKVKERHVLLFSTDLTLSAHHVVRLHRARFQIEFLFRDAKSGAGLTHYQSRNAQALHNHWNAAFAIANLAKLAAKQTTSSPLTPFSFGSCRQKQCNVHFLQVVSSILRWDWNAIKAHPRFQHLQNHSIIAP